MRSRTLRTSPAIEFREYAERAMRLATSLEHGPARARLVTLAAYLHRQAVFMEAAAA
jgi:hypothetical protein